MLKGEKIELVRGCFAAFERQDLQAFQDRVTEDVEWEPSSLRLLVGREATPYRGHDGIRDWFAEVRSLPSYTVRPREFSEVGDKVLVTAGVSFHTGTRVMDGVIRLVFAVREDEGKVASLRTYLDEREALRAVGLES